MKNSNIEWKYEAVKCIESDSSELTKEEATNLLKEYGFTDDEIEYALNTCGIE
jgi:hypothetical protein